MFRWDTIWNVLYESAQMQKQDKQKRKSNLVILVHHKNTEWRDRWNKGLGTEIFNKLEFHLKESQKEPYTIELLPLETTMINDIN
jgi:hypothetical protein